MSTITSNNKIQSTETDFLPLHGTDYVEFYVGNAKQSAHYYITAFGFQPLAYAGPETGMKDKVSYVVRQNKLTLMLTTPLRSGNEIADHIYKHGDGVKALALLQYVDHCVGNVGWNQMNPWVSFYQNVMGFRNILSFDDNDISTEYSALMSKVMSNGNGYVKFPINEPAEGKKKSQVEEYLDFYAGEGVQHVAMATNHIVETVMELRSRGVEFLQVPTTYYDDLLDRVGHIDEDLAPLKELGILVDRDNEGYLLQIFTKPVEDRPTLFFEIIQRKGANSFGKGNFKALFEAIEREQEARGNL